MALSTSRTLLTQTGINTTQVLDVGGLSSSGIATFSNFKTGTTDVHSVGVNAATMVVGSAVTSNSDGIEVTGIVTATSFVGSGANLTGIDATAIQTGTTKVQTSATVISNQVSGAGIATVQAGGLDVTGIITATGFKGSGANLTALNATQLTSGTIPDARFPATLPAVSGANLTGIEVGMSTASAQVSGITTVVDLSKDDIRLDCTGLVTIDTKGGTEGGNHVLRIVNSGISTVTFNSYFKFPSGASPALPTASGAISLISFTVHTQGRVGVASVFLAGASVNFS